MRLGMVIAIVFCGVIHASAQAQPAQPLDDAWWTGPMLAPSASTLPRGHILIEPYFFDLIGYGAYDRDGASHRIRHAERFGSLTYLNYGLADRFTVGVIPTFAYNTVSNGLSSSGVGFGDVTFQGQYRLRKFHEGSWLPTTSVCVQETFPTGKYDRLSRSTDGIGSGAYTTTIGLYTQTFFWLPNGRILRMRLNGSEALSRRARVEDASVYGTDVGFRGWAKPGASFLFDAAWEYSLTKRWVLALDATYSHGANTSVIGYDSSNPLTAHSLRLDSGSNDAFVMAPAVEYNLSSKVGVLLGVRVVPAGRNVTATVAPVLAINIVH
jgi:hypothetical protein